MSRIGKKPVIISSGVTITQADGVVTVKGPKGELTITLHPLIKIEITESEVNILRDGEESQKRALQGLTRSLIQNMVTGVTEGFIKRLEINGVGYRAQPQGKKLVLSLGYSHPIEYAVPDGVEVTQDAEKKNVLIVSGIDKQKVGQTAAEIRSFRKPEPYKGKGIKYEDEYIKRKAGKTAAKAGA
ncbi:50S ribosomal protein L6 [Candidatus Peregrinibacteria bacterium]|jgi:large subunit ribosomal protein L6|nr:50S ribosomal protein L6 [Candidatus Peregrinibacteria bacterium]MBT4631636.1 50S ribosomal protein L6 [Candidatus Peregrinibacteria bacterium]MBT5516764.1 50S ribosomal protein L6 [Candidatus Peregrinibacteria bacterium]MBT5823954.1 50S ribosomal protein L6 [Candidatus Peregrinibacteria bacterium]